MTAVLAKAHPILKLILIVLVLVFQSVVVFGQRPSSTPPIPPPPRPTDGQARPSDDRPLSTFEEEIRAKREIKLAEKEHEENLSRAREIAELGKQLNDGLKGKTSIDRVSLKKIERLEKLTKKIRGEAGGEDEELQIVDRPTDVSSAAIQIAKTSESLSKDVLDTPRQVVSASVIGNANVLLELIKLIRGFDRKP